MVVLVLVAAVAVVVVVDMVSWCAVVSNVGRI